MAELTPPLAGRVALAILAIVLVGFGVAVPVINQTVAVAGLSGLSSILAGFISTVVILILFLYVVRPIA